MDQLTMNAEYRKGMRKEDGPFSGQSQRRRWSTQLRSVETVFYGLEGRIRIRHHADVDLHHISDSAGGGERTSVRGFEESFAKI